MKHFSILVLATTLINLSTPSQAAWLNRQIEKDTYTETRYPIVLVHGILGFDNILGIDYFYRIPAELKRSGATVYIAELAAFQGTESHGEALARQVEEIIAITGKDKVNLIGHSQGGNSARYVASVYPALVASVTTVGGANHGTLLSRVITGTTGLIPHGNDFLQIIANAFGSIMGIFAGSNYRQDYLQSMADLSIEGVAGFNIKYPEGLPSQECGSGNEIGSNGVRYFSWSGNGQLTHAADPSSFLMLATSIVFLGEPNDGLVSSCSSHLGKVLRDNYHMNHLDSINHVFGLHSLSDTDPVTLYRAQANRLKRLGL